MREILFRGKIKNSNDWVEGIYYKQTEHYGDPCEKHYIITSAESLEYDQALDYYEVIPETVGQFTGLTDKNGKKIFEGDIVSQGIDNFVVKWNNEQSKFDISIGECGFCVAGFNEPTMKLYEVIGNIHDNPELLKGE